MLRRLLFSACTVAVAIVALAAPALAKTGVTEAEIPSNTTAGEPFEVTFTLVDHDGGLSDDAQMVLVARNVASGESLEFPGTPQGDIYHWAVEVTLPTDGAWALTVKEETLGFQQDLRSITVAANPSLGVTRAQMDAAITDATADLNKQVSSMALEIDGLQKELGALTAERDTLQKQITGLQSAPPAAEESGVAWWLAAVVGAIAAAVVTAGGYLFAARRGLLARPERRELAPSASGAGD